MTYAAIKSLHLIFVISWFAGLFYIFRLFVYHVQNWENAGVRGVLEVMEGRLLRYIMLPAAAGSLAFGLALFYMNPLLSQSGWLWLKFAFVGVLFAYHGLAAWTYRAMKGGRQVLSERACRAINEVPTLALIAISFLVFLKPF